MLPLAWALLQLVVSAKPGLVDIVHGETNVYRYEQVKAGKTIRTGDHSQVELSLGWNAFLRLNENSTVVLDSADRTNVAIRMEAGSGLIEVTEINKRSPIMVTSGNLKTVIDSKGVYRFSENSASVFKGRLKTFDKSAEVRTGWQITNDGGAYRRIKLETGVAPEIKRFMNGPRAGFVNAVDGETNVHLHQQVERGKPVQTGPAGHVELLLAPGTFLRLGENSTLVIESDSLKDAAVRVVSGAALLESDVIDARLSTRVVVGARKARIRSAGLYRLTSETASVVAGALQIEGETGSLEYMAGKGRRITAGPRAYQESDIPTNEELDDLDRWSARRSYELATANFMAHYSGSYPNFFLFQNQSPGNAAWIYSPWLNGFTFIPRQRYESYYKHTFVPLYVLLPTPAPLPNLTAFPQLPIDSIPVRGVPSAGPEPASVPVPAPAPTPAPAPNPAPAPVPEQSP